MQDVILSPVITEKSMQLVKAGKYTFRVAKMSDKKKIKKALKDKFNVDVVKISTMIVKPERKSVQRREFILSAYKKAIIKIKEGQKIDLFEIGGAK